jgi:hypothetical protein
MPVLGTGGIVKLIREAPEPVVLPVEALAASYNAIYLRSPEFWSGDEVLLTGINGLPLDLGENGPDCPDGYAMYQGSTWYVGNNRAHIATDLDGFYDVSDSAQFYMRKEETGFTVDSTLYIHRDQLDRISFYTTRSAALNGHPSNRISLFNVDYGFLVLAAAGGADYNNAIADCVAYLGEEWVSDTQDELTLKSICDFAPTYQYPAAGTEDYANADLTPRWYIDNTDETGALWMQQCGLAGWSLNLNAQQVDTTAVGEKFGDAIKSIVNGGGTFDFLVDRNASETKNDSTALMQLLLLTEKGCKAKAQFWMVSDQESSGSLLPGDLYYEADILVTTSSINVRPTEIIAGSADFVTVGEIVLKMGAY